MNPHEQTSVELKSKVKIFHSKKRIWKLDSAILSEPQHVLLNSPADTWRDDNVIITSKRNNDIIASRVRVENLTGLAGIVNATVYKTELIFTRLGHGKSVQIINIVYIYNFSVVANCLSLPQFQHCAKQLKCVENVKGYTWKIWQS